MKAIKFLSMMLCLVASMTFAACGGGDGDGGGGGSEPPQTEDSAIVKTLKSYKWKTEILNIDVSDAEDYLYYEDGYATLYFLEDGNGIEVQSLLQLDSDGYEDSGVECFVFNYYIEDDNIKINRNYLGRYFNGTFKLDGNKLVSVDGSFYGGYTFMRGAITSSDYDYIPSTGSCGNNCKWKYEPLNKKLTISGSGDMYDYTDNNKTPWNDFYIEWVEMDDDVTSVGDYAFFHKTELNKVDFSYNLRRVGKYAFEQTLLSEISLWDKVEHIGKYAFAGCSYLKKAYLSGEELKHIDDAVFFGCENLSVSLDRCEKLQTIGQLAFNNVTKVSVFTPSQVLTSVGSGAFSDLKVKTLELPNSLTEIESQAFCGTFSTIRIGNGVTYIADNGFVSTASSGQMYVNMGTPPTTDGDVIANGTGFSGAESKWTLYVPVGCKSAYSKKSPWNKFKSIVEDSSLEGGNANNDNENGNDDGGNTQIKVDYEDLSYIADGKTYKMILVDGGSLPPFYMMQTEVPILGYLQIGDTYIGAIDKNADQCIIKAELRTFIAKLNEATGLEFRLPTEAEWKFAAKGGAKSKNYAYSGSDDIDDVAWYKGNSSGPHDIATKQPNELGLYDMSGNYAEVCSDDPVGIDGRTYGGCWKYTASDCTPTSWKSGNTSASKIPGTIIKELNAVDGRYITVRLVYSIPE